MRKEIEYTLNDIEQTIKIEGKLDKTDGFTYYTFHFDPDTFIVISKFDSDQWKIANMTSDALADKLGSMIRM